MKVTLYGKKAKSFLAICRDRKPKFGRIKEKNADGYPIVEVEFK